MSKGHHRLIALALLLSAQAAVAQSPLAVALKDPSLEWGPCPEFFSADCRIAVLQGDPAGPNADVFFRVAAGDVLPHHWHSSAERMVLVEGELEVQYDGHEAVILRPGMYAYGPAKAPHRGRCLSDGNCTLFIAFEQAVDAHLVK